MAVTQIWKASRVRADDGRPSAAGDGRAPTPGGGRGRRRGHRAGSRLWALLNAQALLNGGAGNPGGVAHIEDDRRRMAARRAK